MRVHLPTALRSYAGAAEVEAEGATVGALLLGLDRRFPGLRFRVVDEQDRLRPHLRLFVNGEQVFDLGRRLRADDELHLVLALSGG